MLAAPGVRSSATTLRMGRTVTGSVFRSIREGWVTLAAMLGMFVSAYNWFDNRLTETKQELITKTAAEVVRLLDEREEEPWSKPLR